jgi:hypothetical protein
LSLLNIADPFSFLRHWTDLLNSMGPTPWLTVIHTLRLT